jgi:signal transduction histidine kinase
MPGERAEERRSHQGAPFDLVTCVFEALPLGIGLFELRGDAVVYRTGNREFSRVLRLDRPPRQGDLLKTVFTGSDWPGVVQLFEKVARTGEPQSYFSAEPPGEDHDRIWNLDAYPVFSGGRVSYVMVLAEQSEQKFETRHRQQQETDRLREKADQLAELEKAKSEFLRLASHELRGPAAMLGGYLSMMEDEALGPIPDRLRPVLPLLRAKAAQINMLANEMVEAARLEDRRLQLKRVPINLGEVVKRSYSAALTGLSSKHRLRLVDHARRAVMVSGDAMRLEIIVGNLIDNAIKYSPEGGDIMVELSVEGDLAILRVRDAGIGIAPDDMERLFIRFNRIAPRADVPGTGLGLYLARELARLHGGDIVAVSKLGKGSEFTLSLPLERRAT